jgi:hypothetical protein
MRGLLKIVKMDSMSSSSRSELPNKSMPGWLPLNLSSLFAPLLMSEYQISIDTACDESASDLSSFELETTD